MFTRVQRTVLSISWLIASSLGLWPLVAEDPVEFVRDIQPIFERHCVECHGATKQESGLRLDIKSKALAGGDNQGPDIIPGKPEASPLIELVTTSDSNQRMPPEGPGLSEVKSSI